MSRQAQTLQIDALKPNSFNVNHTSPENQIKLEESIRRLGFFRPVVVRELLDGSLEIVGGFHRWKAAQAVGLNEVPIFNLGNVDDKRAKEICIADNARYGADDALELSSLLQELGDIDDLSEFLPYSDADLKTMFSVADIVLEDLDLDDDLDNFEPLIKEDKPLRDSTIMRFKLKLGDAEKVGKLIKRVQKEHGLTESDELSNAGDALVKLLLEKNDD